MDGRYGLEHLDATLKSSTLFAENLAEVSSWKAKVFAFLLFISMAVLAPKTTFCEGYNMELLFGIYKRNVHVR